MLNEVLLLGWRGHRSNWWGNLMYAGRQMARLCGKLRRKFGTIVGMRSLSSECGGFGMHSWRGPPAVHQAFFFQN